MQITHAVRTGALLCHHFALFFGNSLDGPFHPWHVESNRIQSNPKNKLKCGLVWPENIVLWSIPDVAFLDAVTDCIEWQWFSKVLPSPCDYVHHCSMTVFRTIPPESSMVTHIGHIQPRPLRTKISPDYLNIFTIKWTVDGERPLQKMFCNFALRNTVFVVTGNFGTKWWTTTHPCM